MKSHILFMYIWSAWCLLQFQLPSSDFLHHILLHFLKKVLLLISKQNKYCTMSRRKKFHFGCFCLWCTSQRQERQKPDNQEMRENVTWRIIPIFCSAVASAILLVFITSINSIWLIPRVPTLFCPVKPAACFYLLPICFLGSFSFWVSLQHCNTKDNE